MALRLASMELRNDKDVFLAAACKNGNSLVFVPSWLKNDDQVVTAAVVNDVMALRYASARLRTDKEFVLGFAKEDSKVLCAMGWELKIDSEFLCRTITANIGCYFAAAELVGRNRQKQTKLWLCFKRCLVSLLTECQKTLRRK